MSQFSDNFNRTSIGSDWADASGFDAFTIYGSDNVGCTGTGLMYVTTSVATFTNFQWAEVLYDAVSSFDFGGPAIRVSAGGTGYAVYTDGVLDSSRGLVRVDNSSTITSLSGTPSIDTVATDTARIMAVSSTLTMYVNGEIAHTVTDSTYSSGQPGILYDTQSGTTTRLDDFFASDQYEDGGSDYFAMTAVGPYLSTPSFSGLSSADNSSGFWGKIQIRGNLFDSFVAGYREVIGIYTNTGYSTRSKLRIAITQTTATTGQIALYVGTSTTALVTNQFVRGTDFDRDDWMTIYFAHHSDDSTELALLDSSGTAIVTDFDSVSATYSAGAAILVTGNGAYLASCPLTVGYVAIYTGTPPGYDSALAYSQPAVGDSGIKVLQDFSAGTGTTIADLVETGTNWTINSGTLGSFYGTSTGAINALLTSPSLDGFRFYNDNGSESAATAAANEDTNHSITAGGIIRLRTQILTPDAGQYGLEYRKKNETGPWTPVPPEAT